MDVLLYPKLVVAILKWEQLEKQDKISELVSTLPKQDFLESIWNHMKNPSTFVQDRAILYYCLAKCIRFHFKYFSSEENADLLDAIVLDLFMDRQLPSKAKSILLESLAIYTKYKLFDFLEMFSSVLQNLIQEGVIKSESTCCENIAECLDFICDNMETFKDDLDSPLRLLSFSFVSKPSIDMIGTIRALLQSKEMKERQQILRILFRICYFKIEFVKYFAELFERVLYFESMPLRVDCLTHMWELVFVHSSQSAELFVDTSCYENTMIENMMQFLYGPHIDLVHSCIIGMQRILLYNALPDLTEIMISYLTQMYSRSSLVVNNKSSKKEAIVEQSKEQQMLLGLILEFFQLYVGTNKESHQKEIANTILHVVMENFRKGVLPMDEKTTDEDFCLFQNQIMFLFSFLQPNQFESNIIENIMVNLESLPDITLPSISTIKYWLSLQ